MRMVRGWYDARMAEADRSEKITINVGLIDLGQIDLLVSEGFFTSQGVLRAKLRSSPSTRALVGSSLIDQVHV